MVGVLRFELRILAPETRVMPDFTIPRLHFGRSAGIRTLSRGLKVHCATVNTSDPHLVPPNEAVLVRVEGVEPPARRVRTAYSTD